MQNPYFDELYRSIRSPEDAFDLYLCPSYFNPLELSDFQGYTVPSVFSDALVHFLFKIEDSGFAKLDVETEVYRQGPRLSVLWKSGTYRKGYLNETDLKALKQLSRTHFRNQLKKYRPYL